jgi:hypothetical protein
MNRNTYFDNPSLSRGLLQKFINSSRTGAALIDKEYDSKAKSFGRAFHYYMESQEAFNNNVIVIPDDSIICEEIGGKKPRSTKAYRVWKESILANSDTKEIITAEEFNTIEAMCDNIQANEMYIHLVRKDGVHAYEKAYYATINGIRYKALADYAIEMEDKIIICDWKTTISDLSRDNAALYELRKWKLHFQQFHYTKVIEEATGKKVQFLFFFSEKTNGNEVLPVIISHDSELITEAAIMWEDANEHYQEYLKGEIKGIDAKLDNGILIIE